MIQGQALGPFNLDWLNFDVSLFFTLYKKWDLDQKWTGLTFMTLGPGSNLIVSDIVYTYKFLVFLSFA